MNLGEMRTLLRLYVGDDGQDILADDVAKAYINVAMQHVVNWADSRDQGLFYQSIDVVLEIPAGQPQKTFQYIRFYGEHREGDPSWDIDPPMRQPGTEAKPFGRFRRLIRVERVNFDPENANAEHVQELQEVEFENMHKYKNDNQKLPQVAVASDGSRTYEHNDGPGTFIVRPERDRMDLRLWYIRSLPNMNQDEDTPGDHNGSPFEGGPSNALPVEYHPMIPAYAAVQFLVSNNADATQWTTLYAEYKESLAATLAKRGSTRV